MVHFLFVLIWFCAVVFVFNCTYVFMIYHMVVLASLSHIHSVLGCGYYLCVVVRFCAVIALPVASTCVCVVELCSVLAGVWSLLAGCSVHLHLPLLVNCVHNILLLIRFLVCLVYV